MFPFELGTLCFDLCVCQFVSAIYKELSTKYKAQDGLQLFLRLPYNSQFLKGHQQCSNNSHDLNA